MRRYTLPFADGLERVRVLPMQWEYRVDDDPPEPEADYLAKLGLAGWELVSVVHCDHTGGTVYYWKRPVTLPGTAERR